MPKHILFNFASRSRPDKFALVVSQIKDFCSQPYTILGKVDEDDPQLFKYLEIEGVSFAVGKSENKIHAINRNIPNEGWDIILDVSDDFIFNKFGFDDIIRENCGPDDFVHFPEPFAKQQHSIGRNEDISVMYCAGIDYYKRTGFIYNPVYLSLFCDNEGTAIAKKLGRYKLMTKFIFFHAHHLAGYGTKDEQNKKTDSFYLQDKKTYTERKAKGFK